MLSRSSVVGILTERAGREKASWELFPFVRLLVCYRPLAHAFLASVFWPQHDLSHNFLDSQLALVRH